MQSDRSVYESPTLQSNVTSSVRPPKFASPRPSELGTLQSSEEFAGYENYSTTKRPDAGLRDGGLVISQSANDLSQTGTLNEAMSAVGREIPFTLRSLFEIPFIYYKTILTSLVVSILLGWLAILVWPRAYESQAKLNIKIGRESVALDPSATTSETMLMQQTREEEIVSTLEVLNSRQVAIAVIDKIGADAVISGEVPTDGENGVAKKTTLIKSMKRAARGVVDTVVDLSGVRDPVSDEELAILEFEDAVSIYAPKKSSVVTIESTAKTPEMAKLLVEETISAFLTQHRKSTGTAGSYEFFEQQVTYAEDELNEMIQHRADFLIDNNLVSVDTKREILRAKTVAINNDLFEKLARIEQVNSEVSDLNVKVANMDARVNSATKEIASVEYTGLRTKVFELEVKEKQLSSKYRDEHPVLIGTREQLADAKALLKQTSPRDTNSDTIINPAKQKAEQKLLTLNTQLVGLQASIDEKKKQLSELAKETKELVGLERELIEMDREIAKSEESFSILNSKLEQSRLIKELENKEITNISVFQPATFAQRPHSPNKKILALGSVFMGLVIGVSLAFVREFNSSKVRSASNLSSLVGPSMVIGLPHVLGRKLDRDSSDLYIASCQNLLVDLVLENRKRRPNFESNQTAGLCIGIVGCEGKSGVSTFAKNLVQIAEEQLDLRSRYLEYDSIYWTMEDEFDQRLAELKSSNELVVVDLPPASEMNHPARENNKLDCLLFVAQAGATDEETIRTALERFLSPISYASQSAPIAGLILTNHKEHIPWFVRRLTNA